MVTRRRIQAHSSNGGRPYHVTKVLLQNFRLLNCRLKCRLKSRLKCKLKCKLKMRGLHAAAMWLAISMLPMVCAAAADAPEKPAEALYLQLGQVDLDPGQVYQVRGASLDRSAIHITLEDGTIGFTHDVMGRITGAFFEGYGEVLLTPPNEVERRSMSLFTGMAILEEHFATAYFRFNDDAAEELRPDLRAAENKQEFIDHWAATVQNLANADAMRLLMSFSRLLPVKGSPTSSEQRDLPGSAGDRFLHARLQGTKLGVFDVYFDSAAPEQVQVGQAKPAENGIFITTFGRHFPRRCGDCEDQSRSNVGVPARARKPESARGPRPNSSLYHHDRGSAPQTDSCKSPLAVGSP